MPLIYLAHEFMRVFAKVYIDFYKGRINTINYSPVLGFYLNACRFKRALQDSHQLSERYLHAFFASNELSRRMYNIPELISYLDALISFESIGNRFPALVASNK